ncbi:MAG TPA: YbjN domain-containing protein [Anaerolineae bacterium]|mgnify:CR=1 FL=1|nr:YbjN domain-containing protein [Anaerolineae bacterium]HPL28893.1 YbjN domain-containing protein [Anaerolineae bacterium]
MATAQVLAEGEVTVANLAQLFKRAFFKASINHDGDLVVQTDGPRVLVSVDADKKLIKLMSVYGIQKAARLELKHALVNKMNDEFILCRFSIPEAATDLLVVDYYLPFEEGIPEFQIMSALRWFARVAPGAIRASDQHNLVE